ncbi:MAG: TIR domain-containing protein, partial [Huintestinicola sp.]
MDNSTVCECEYCGTQQTIPTIRDDVTANLFNRANNLRMKNEFDKAQEIYEKIVSNNGNESEAYWGIVLCKFGIEYVEDPATFKKIPTCHRTQLESVLTDVDYLAAIEHADLMQKSVYEAEAKAIDKLQHDILDIVHKEEPFDVFICYKETDENGKRTQDSVIANDIYHQLTQEGFKVFYAAITLEDKLGQEYEPYIFAALNSAKVMLAVGTKPEYFSAVWVKNEWSRYLKLMKNDRSKMLFPCYKDMDAYDLPEEFSHLQAQDMSKIGFINDLVRGIKKVIVKDEPKAAERVVEKVVETAGNTNTAPLLKRAFMFLEDSEWDSANEYAEKVLDIDPECADAYIVKLYSEYEICNRNEFRSSEEDVDDLKDSSNFKKAYKFGKQAQLDEDINEILYNQAAREEEKADSEEEYNNVADCFKKLSSYKNSAARAMNCIEKGKECAYQNAEKAFANANDKKSYNRAADLYRQVAGYKDADEKAEKAVEAGKECAYQKAEKTFESADTKEEYNRAADMYRNISGYKDADEKAEKAIEAGKECAYQIAEKTFENAYNEESYNKAAELYRHISGYKDAYEKRNICVEKASECNKEDKYNRANNLVKQDNIDSIEQAIQIFSSISEWQDSSERAEKCRQRIKEKEEEQRRRAEIAEQGRIQNEKNKKKKKTIIGILSGAVVICIIGIVAGINIVNANNYKNALALFENGSYDEAINAFSALGDYKDSSEKCLESKYYKASNLMKNSMYDEAAVIFEDLGEYKDSADILKYYEAMKCVGSGGYSNVKYLISKVSEKSELMIDMENKMKEEYSQLFGDIEVVSFENGVVKIKFGK